MTDYYIGASGSDAADGLSWANRKLTLNGVEDVPIAAGDTCYIGPGTYRETLTLDIDGSAGNIITYIGDVTGENTDGVGGIIRISGSDNDTSTARTNCVTGSARDYRTFRGIWFSHSSNDLISLTGSPTNIMIEDCSFSEAGDDSIVFDGASMTALTVRRCFIISGGRGNVGIKFNSGSDAGAITSTVENCIIVGGGNGKGIESTRSASITVKNSTIGWCERGLSIATAASATTPMITANNCLLIHSGSSACRALSTGEITEDYNTFFMNNLDRTNTSIGSNSQTYPPLFVPPLLLDGFQFPMAFCELSEWSAVRGIAGTGEATDDFLGLTRPTTSAKKSWGPVQFRDFSRETGTTRGSSTASIKLADAGQHQMFVPVTNTSTTFSVYCYRETNYAGTNPQLVIKQPGIADDTTTDTGSASAWNELTTTLTPDAGTNFVVVELVSNNTATSGSYDTFFDDLTVS